MATGPGGEGILPSRAPSGAFRLAVSRVAAVRWCHLGYYPIRIVKLSISLPDDQVGFLDAYADSHGIKSRSGAIQAALRLLRASQLGDDYASAWAEWSEDPEPWDRTANDGITGRLSSDTPRREDTWVIDSS